MSDDRKHTMRRRRWPVVVLSIMTAALFSCSVNQTTDQPDCRRPGSALIVAQSVATASQIPCLDGVEPGWEVVSVSVNHERTIVTFDSDRAGEDAARLRFEETCDFSNGSERESGFDDIERFDEVEQVAPSFRGSRYYVFEGGCVWWQFDFESEVGVFGADALGDRLMFVPRSVVNQGVADDFIDEDL